MNKLISVLMFATGAAIGSVVTWKLVKTKYEQLAQEEIESVKEIFSKREIDDIEDIEYDEYEFEDFQIDDNSKVKPDIMEYAAKIQKESYQNYANESKEVRPMNDKKPYVIAPEEYGELDNYQTKSLTYYDDEILTDDDTDEVIKDVDSIVGLESLKTFGEYEDDSVFVRNEKLKTDFEILLDVRKYSEVFNPVPHLAEEE